MTADRERLGYLFGWLAGLFFLFGGVMSLGESILGGLIIIAGALLLIPVLGSRIGIDPKPRAALAVILVFIGIIISTSGSPPGDQAATTTPIEPGEMEEATTRINSLIREADTAVTDAFQAILDDDFDLARSKSLEAKAKLKEIKALSEGLDLPPEDARHLETFIEYEQRWSTLLYKTANLEEAANRTMQSIEETGIEANLPALELLKRGNQENAQDWRDLADYVYSIKEFRERQGITDEQVQVLYDLADSTEELAVAIDGIINDYRDKTPEYVPVAEREIRPSAEPPAQPAIITEELASFFDSFDTNRDNKLSIGEAQEFFYWVENNIQYRYDSEDELEPVVGTLVGDGRPGFDYRQRPIETYDERAGDCEDMATLEQAFYRYYGIDAYVAGVNAEEPDVLDHATAIVWIADRTDLFRETLGDLVYYEIGEGARDIYGDPMRPGVYMLVDNAYSGALGYLSGGLEPGTFRVHCAIPLEKGYDDWREVVRRCGVPMD